MYVKSQEIVDSYLFDHLRHLIFPRGKYQIRTVPGLHPTLEVLDAVNLLIEIGQQLPQESFQLVDGVDVSGVSVVLGFGRVLHFFTGVADEFSGGVVAQHGVVVFGSPHIVAHF